MNTKLTVNINQLVIERAKKYAQKKGSSLSSIIENYLKLITSEEQKTDYVNAPITKSLRGSFKTFGDIDYKDELSKALSEKYDSYG